MLSVQLKSMSFPQQPVTLAVTDLRKFGDDEQGQ